MNLDRVIIDEESLECKVDINFNILLIDNNTYGSSISLIDNYTTKSNLETEQSTNTEGSFL